MCSNRDILRVVPTLVICSLLGFIAYFLVQLLCRSMFSSCQTYTHRNNNPFTRLLFLHPFRLSNYLFILFALLRYMAERSHQDCIQMEPSARSRSLWQLPLQRSLEFASQSWAQRARRCLLMESKSKGVLSVITCVWMISGRVDRPELLKEDESGLLEVASAMIKSICGAN